MVLMSSPPGCHLLCLVCDHLSIPGAAPVPLPVPDTICFHPRVWKASGQLGLKASCVSPHLLSGIQLMQPKKAPPSRARFKQSRARWWLAYTLLNNPSLTACRKTALSDPTANGTQLSPPKP